MNFSNRVKVNFKFLVKIRLTEETSLLVVFLSIVAIIGIIIPQFRTIYNILSVVRQFSLICIVAMGETLVLISGGFDLSVGSIAALCGMFNAHMMVTLHWPIGISIFFGILLGALCGLLNGLLIGKVKINPLIATLASSWVYSGIILITTRGYPVTELPERFYFIGQGRVLGIPFPIVLMVLFGIILSFFLSRTIYGRYIYALGGNARASILSGLNTTSIKMLVFILCGICAGLAGIILSSRVGSAQATGGSQWTLPAIASAVIGGVSLSGGKGKIYGAIIGSAFMGIINNILVLLHISSYWQTLISGFVVIIAVTIDSIRRTRESK